jgi:hypothetical protein
VHAIRRKRVHVRVGAQSHVTDWVSRAAPGIAGAVLGWGFGKARSRLR